MLLAQDRLPEAMPYIRQAHNLQPLNPKYAFTLAFYLRHQGDIREAIEVLNKQVQQKRTTPDIYFLLGELYEKTGQPEAAQKVYQQALGDEGLLKTVRPNFATKLRALTTMKNQRD